MDKQRPKTIPATEAQILAATVGERVPLNKTVDLAPYNPEWPRRYATLEGQIREAPGATVLMIAHVGSTSVPGLCAKPVIDVVVAVPDSADEGSYGRRWSAPDTCSGIASPTGSSIACSNPP